MCQWVTTRCAHVYQPPKCPVPSDTSAFCTDDGSVEGDDGDIWNVCEIDGTTGNVVATDKSRHDLLLKGGYVEVPAFTHAPTDAATLAFWMQVMKKMLRT